MHWGLSSPWRSALRCPPLHGVPVTAAGVIVSTEMKEPRAVPSQSSRPTGEPATCPAQANIRPTGRGLEVHSGRRDGETGRDVAAWSQRRLPGPRGEHVFTGGTKVIADRDTHSEGPEVGKYAAHPGESPL